MVLAATWPVFHQVPDVQTLSSFPSLGSRQKFHIIFFASNKANIQFIENKPKTNYVNIKKEKYPATTPAA